MSGQKTGVSNTDDFMHRVLRGCIQLKSAPDANMMVDMTPVDYVSHHSSIEAKESLGKAFVKSPPHPLA